LNVKICIIWDMLHWQSLGVSLLVFGGWVVLRNIPPLQGGARFALLVGFRTPERISPRTRTLVVGSLQYLWDQSNQVREDIRRPHWALCLMRAKWTYSMQGYKREYKKLFRQDLLSLWDLFSLSLFLSSLYRHLTDLIVGGGSAGQPPAGLSCFAGQGAGEGEVSDDATSPDQHFGAVCGNDVVAPTETKIQNGDWWSETPFIQRGRADRVDLGFMSDRSGRKCYGPEPKSDRFALINDVSEGTHPSIAFCWQSYLCADKISSLLLFCGLN